MRYKQNCNITYRIKDFNQRKLETEKACETLKYNRIKVINRKKGRIIYNKNFKLVKFKINSLKELTTNKSFKVISVIKGNGMTILIPACVNKYYIEGNLEIIIYN